LNAHQLETTVTKKGWPFGKLFELAVFIVAVGVIGNAYWDRSPDGVVRISKADWKRLADSGLSISPAADRALTIVEFIDYQCPACAQLEPFLSALENEYGGRIQRTIRHFPIRQIHPDAERAAYAVVCAARQGRSTELHRHFLSNQGALKNLQPDTLIRLVQLDSLRFAECLKTEDIQKTVANDVALGTLLGVTGTPTIVLDGYWLSTPSPQLIRSLVESRLR
jgi:protein-disulfide isomerase